MTITWGARTLATAALLLVALAACTEDKGVPTPSLTTSAPAVTTSPTPPTESQVASAAAEAKVREYYVVRNRLRQDPSQPLASLKGVAISTELTAQQRVFKNARRDGIHQTGDTTLTELKIQAVNLDNSDPKAGKVPVVQVDVCYDVSGVDLLDKDGKSVVSPGRPDSGWIRHTVANYEWESNPGGAWRVASSQDLEKSPCAAS